MSYHSLKNLPVVYVLLIAILCLFASPDICTDNLSRAAINPAEAVYKEDYNGDGSLNVADAIALLILGRDDPTSPVADYDGDGTYDITDVISLLLNIRDGKIYSIMGKILEDSQGVQGVEVVIMGGDVYLKVSTDSNGSFRIDNIPNGTYEMKPIIRTYYYTFDPDELEVTINGESVTVPDIEATTADFTLSGKVLEDNLGLADVTVSVKGVGVDTTVVTDSDGAYSVEGLFNAPYAVVPSKENYTFDPYSLAITLYGDSIIQDIEASPAGPSPSLLYTVGGRVFCSVQPLSNVTVLLMGDMEASTITDVSGSYTFIVPDGEYTVVGLPIPLFQMFNPTSYNVTVNGADVIDLDFFGFGAGL